MAEARNAIDLYYLQKQGFHITGVEDGYYTLSVSVPYPSTFVKKIHASLKNSLRFLRNRLWPATLSQVFCVMGVVSAVVVRAPQTSWFRSGRLAEVLWSLDVFLNKANPIHSSLAVEVRVWYLASLAAFLGMIGIMTCENLLLRCLLRYNSWLYVKPKTKPPITVVLWGALVKICSGSVDLTYSFSSCLPSLPLPSLKHTIDHYLVTVKPLLSKEEYEETEKTAREFMKNEGRKFQWYLWYKWLTSRNYVAEWWEKYVYLRGRNPLAVNSNYYVTDSVFRPTDDQVERAANLTYFFLEFKDMIENQTLKPLLIRNLIPLCMDQYTRMFGSTRIPGRDMDKIKHNEYSRHIVVLYRGEYFRMDVYHGARGTKLVPCSVKEIEANLREIVVQVDKLRDTSNSLVQSDMVRKSASMNRVQSHRIQSYSDLSTISEDKESFEKVTLKQKEGSGIAALTAGPRSNWAEIREAYFSRGVNRSSLRDIDRAAFLVVLDNSAYADLTERGRSLFTGNGFNRYFDKSLSLVVFKDGYCGLNAEHSWADAPVVAHLWEFALLKELKHYQDQINVTKGKGTLSHHQSLVNIQELGELKMEEKESITESGPSRQKPSRLMFQIDDELQNLIHQAGVFSQNLVSDVDLKILKFDSFGASYMKKNGLSPDAFIQMAFQLAYYRNRNQFDLTYESSMTRLFRYGRTETIRALSVPSAKWVLKMEEYKDIFGNARRGLDTIDENPSKDATVVKQRKEELIVLLREAAASHSKLTKDSMVGKGVDRHLFALYITSRGFDIDSKFLNSALSLPWRLSTSQQPQNQTQLRKSLHPDIASCFMSPGGGFGPVADDGYGVSYMVVGGDVIYFHVSSKVSAAETNSTSFVQCIKGALLDMSTLFS